MSEHPRSEPPKRPSPIPERADAPRRRSITPRKGLPSSRAVVGGLLVAVAALGTWVLATGAGDEPGQRYLAAARPLGPGERISADDLTTVTLDLPGAQRSQAFSDAEEVIDAVALGPLAPGDLLMAGSVGRASGGPDEREVSVAVEADWAVAGRLRPGDHIDVFVTDDGADEATSRRVLADAVIRRLDRSDGDGLGESNRQVLTVGLTDEDDVATFVAAARAGELTVLRVTGSAPDPSSRDRGVAPADPDGPSEASGASSATTTDPPKPSGSKKTPTKPGFSEKGGR